MTNKRTRGPALALATSLTLFGSQRAHADDMPAAPTNDPKTQAAVDRAIAKVYPALVLIHVLELGHSAGHERKQLAAGSGAIISPEGYIVTNHHVAGKAASIRVTLSSKEELDATLVGTDALADIAIIKLDLKSRPKDATPLAVAKFGRSDILKVGDPVLAMGCPRALSQSVTKGIVANKNMMMPRLFGSEFMLDGEDVGELVQWIGHDAMIQPGNSGGPLVNLDGEIVGINEIGIGTMSGAIPSDIARQVAEELIAHGKIRRTWIGAEFQPLLREDASLPSPDAKGVLVGGVIPGSPAEKGGLKSGDIVFDVDGAPVQVRLREEMPAFNRMLLAKTPGTDLAFKVQRQGKEVALTIKADLRDDAEGHEIESKEWGATLREVTNMVAKELQRPDKKGVIVGSVSPGGPCDKAQPPIGAGDVIVDAGGKAVDGLEGFVKATAELAAGHDEPIPVVVTFERHFERFMTVVEVGVKKPQPPTPESQKPWLAVSTQVLSKKLATALGLKGKKGVRIAEVFPDSTASEAGLKIGDIITHVDGNAVEASEPHDSEVFSQMIRQYKVGTKAELTVIRGTETMKISVNLNEAPQPERELKVHEDSKLEFKARDIPYFDRIRNHWTKDQAGAFVANVESGGWAAVAGLSPGDLILEIDGKPVTTVSDLDALLQPIHDDKAKHVAFLVRRGIHSHFVEIEPKKTEKLFK